MIYRQSIALISLIILLSGIITLPVAAQGTQQQLLTRINNLRSELGLAPYRLNSALSAAAASHARWMVDTLQVTHIQDNGSSPATRAQANGYNSQWVSENIYMGGLASVDTAWTFWVNSSIHYAGLTSDNFRDIGIASAQGEGGRAYVLVFGVPSGAIAASSGNAGNGGSNASGSNAPAAPPSAIIGYDAAGNIQYELQPGDTPGQVLLLFGYTWEDLPALLELNDLTEADVTNLAIGEVLLVPPPQGTYTPTPVVDSNEATAEVTEPAPEITESVAEATENLPATMPPADGILPTPVPDNASEDARPLPPSPQPVEAVGQAATFVAVTPTPTLTRTPTVIPALQVNTVQPATVAVAASATPLMVDDVAVSSSSGAMLPPWLMGLIALQIGIFGYALYEGIRRMRQK